MAASRVKYAFGDNVYVYAESECESNSPDALTDATHRAAWLFRDAMREVFRMVEAEAE